MKWLSPLEIDEKNNGLELNRQGFGNEVAERSTSV
jgi:hypothetical protein